MKSAPSLRSRKEPLTARSGYLLRISRPILRHDLPRTFGNSGKDAHAQRRGFREKLKVGLSAPLPLRVRPCHTSFINRRTLFLQIPSTFRIRKMEKKEDAKGD